MRGRRGRLHSYTSPEWDIWWRREDTTQLSMFVSEWLRAMGYSELYHPNILLIYLICFQVLFMTAFLYLTSSGDLSDRADRIFRVARDFGASCTSVWGFSAGILSVRCRWGCWGAPVTVSIIIIPFISIISGDYSHYSGGKKMYFWYCSWCYWEGA